MDVIKSYKKRQKKARRLLIKTFILALIILGANTYAWFIFFNKFDGSVDANVIAWDVTFYDEDENMDNISIDVKNLQPGMLDYEKIVYVNNSSDVRAMFDYSVEKLVLFGVEYSSEDYDLKDLVNNYFPFKIDFAKSKDILLSGGDRAQFVISVKWAYESDDAFYKLNHLYEYVPSITYYDSSFKEDSTVNASNFKRKVDSGLYIESDDGDSYWGKKAYKFIKESNNKPCLTLKLKLTVSQIKSES